MPIIRYDNYARPFSNLGQAVAMQEEPGWVRRNWDVVLQVLGYLLLIGGTIAERVLDQTIPKDIIIQTDEWNMILDAAQKMSPGLSRQEVELKLCQVFGNRVPRCAVYTPTVFPAPPRAGLPAWVILGAIGVGAYLLLRR